GRRCGAARRARPRPRARGRRVPLPALRAAVTTGGAVASRPIPMVTTSAVAYQPFGRDTWRDPYPLYRRLRDEDPVHRSPGGFWVLSRFADVFAAARDTATFSSAQGLTFSNEVEELGLAPTIVMMDPPDHTRYRRLVSRGFTPRAVADVEPALRRFVAGRVDRLRQLGTADFVAELARPVPNWVVAHYLGVPDDDRHRFEDWTQAIVQA